MEAENESGRTTDQPKAYQIKLKGHLGQEWISWFEGLTITLDEDGNSLLTGTVVDQAALHGLLRKVRDLGMPLLAVTYRDPGDSKDQTVPDSDENQ